MKQLFTIICSLFWATLLFAQISIQSTDLTSIGDVIVRHTDTVPTYGPGSAGPNQIWDFSTAISDTTNTTTVVTVGSTEFSGTFSSSDYAMTGGNDSYLFFEHDANSMTTTGAAGDLLATGEQIESPFSDPLLLHEFPRTYESNFDDTYAFITEADGAGLDLPIPVYRVKLTHTGHVYDTTDAYGTLITPTGTYDALRVKTIDYSTNLLEYKLLSFSPWTTYLSTLDTTVSYTWHTKEEMLAIAEYAYDSIGNPARFTFSTVPPVTTGSDNVFAAKEMNIYPQPASDRLYFKAVDDKINAKIEIYTMDGKCIRTDILTKDWIQVDELKNGMYLLRLKSEGVYKKTLKFIIQK
jgi:hypothetical protein